MPFGKSSGRRIFSNAFIKVLARTLGSSENCSFTSLSSSSLYASFKVEAVLIKLRRSNKELGGKKLCTLSGNSSLKKMVFERFNEHLPQFQFKADLSAYCSSQCPEFENIYTLTTLNKTCKNHEEMNNAPQSCQDESGLLKVLNKEDKKNEKFNSTEDLYNCEKERNVFKGNNIASQIGVRLEGRFVIKNAINLSRRNLSACEISLLSKGLNFVPTANKIDRAKRKVRKEYERILRLMWHFRNNEQSFVADRFRPKSSFNSRNKDVIIEMYLSCLEERLLDIEIPSKRFNNLSKEEREALYNFKDDPTIMIDGAEKEAYRELDDKEVNEQFSDDPSVLANTLMKALEKIRLPEDLPKNTLDYFLVKDLKFPRFYLLPRIHKRLHDVPGRPDISNCGYYTENISSFLDYHLQPLAQKVKSYIKDSNHFFK